MLYIPASPNATGNGVRHIRGRGLRRRKLTVQQHAKLAADIVSGCAQLEPSMAANRRAPPCVPSQNPRRAEIARRGHELGGRVEQSFGVRTRRSGPHDRPGGRLGLHRARSCVVTFGGFIVEASL